jgi:hypothetical protein
LRQQRKSWGNSGEKVTGDEWREKTAGILSFVAICRLKRQFACQKQFILLRLGVERPRSLGKKFDRARRAGIVKAKEKNL